MKKRRESIRILVGQFLNRMGIGMRAKLILIFLVVQVIPLVLLTVMAFNQISKLGDALLDISVADSAEALNDSAVENIERMSTDTAKRVADFLYSRDDDILFLASLDPTLENYEKFGSVSKSPVIAKGEWELASDGKTWIQVNAPKIDTEGGVSTNSENEDMDGFNYRPPEAYETVEVPLYDEITFISLDGMEQIKYTDPDSAKISYPLSQEKKDVSKKENTYIKAEDYFAKLKDLEPGEIYVSDVIGVYVGSNYIGMYTPENVEAAADERGYEIEYKPEEQAYAGQENPNGQRFEGIVRWATPVTDEEGEVTGYVTFALNHDHIMEYTDHITPQYDRYTQLPSAYEGNYAFIWDYQCRSICHPRHHSIVGYDPETGEEQIPWLETSIYEGWQESGIPKWTDYVQGLPTFNEQSRAKKPSADLTQAGLVGLDGRYLDNAPQCTGWMNLTGEGGSGSFYILWSGIYKLNTAAAIPYYTGQYAPSVENDYSKRGFGFVAIGSGLEDFTSPATAMEGKLVDAIENTQSDTVKHLFVMTATLIILVVLIAVLVASSITGKINRLIIGISRFRAGERQFRYNEPVKDEFGALADSFDDMADSIVDSVTNPLCITDMNEKIIYMNQMGLDVYKKELSEMVGSNYKESSIYPSDSCYDPVYALQNGTETEVYYHEKQKRYLKGNASYLFDKDSKKSGYFIETVDMTDIVLEQMKIEEQKSLLDKIFNASPDLIWYMNHEGVYITVNPRFASIADVSMDEFTGKKAEDILPKEIAAGFARNDRKAIAGKAPLYSEEHLEFGDGHEEILDSVRTPIYDTNGILIGLLGFARDVSARVRMDEELREIQLELEKAVEEANQANAHKGEFLARMSHEIRTPMNAIVGLTGIVQNILNQAEQKSEDIDTAKQHISQIEGSSQHLLGLLNDILDLSKIEAGRIELSEEAIDIIRLADTVHSIIRPRCEEKQIQFVTHYDEFDPSTFSIDSLRLRQVLINLLGNAVKFTPKHGRIEFSVYKKEQKDGKTLAEFVIQDTGIGIAEEALDKIFESFEQGGNDITRKHGGTGLGLAISKRIVELFGGEIALTSTLGEGSTFRFAIWMKEVEADLPEKTVITDATGKFKKERILLVDDVAINRIIVKSMLKDTGAMIEEAEDGQDAVEMFKASEPGYYDLILMDVQMPNLNGYDATKAIRALDRSDAVSIPIIAQTANAFKEDIDKALSYGMNGHLAKPIEREMLIGVLFEFIKAEK